VADEYDDQVAALQTRIRDRLEELDPISPDRADYAEVASKVLDAAAELIAFEERLPILRDEPRRQLSLLVVRWSGRAAMAVAVLLALATLPGWVALPWLVLLAVLAGVGVRTELLRVEPVGGRHAEQRLGGYLIGGGTALTLLVVPGLLPLWLLVGVLGLLGAGMAYALRPLRDDGPAEPPDIEPAAAPS
jgi:hypothetical protein